MPLWLGPYEGPGRELEPKQYWQWEILKHHISQTNGKKYFVFHCETAKSLLTKSAFNNISNDKTLGSHPASAKSLPDKYFKADRCLKMRGSSSFLGKKKKAQGKEKTMKRSAEEMRNTSSLLTV